VLASGLSGESFCSIRTGGRFHVPSVASTAMTQPVSRPPSAPEAAPGSEEPTTEFVAHGPGTQPPPHSSIDQEIARSERASAALAATRALARAAFTDSQLAADDAAAAAGEDAAQDAIDTEWVRTEYVALEHTLPPDDEARRDGPPRHLAGGSFNPGIAAPQGRSYPGASMADASLKTRSGAQAQFHHEARHAPRAEALPATGHPARRVVTPAQAAAPSRPHAAARAPRRDGLRFMLAAGLGAVVVLAGGGLAWRAGLLSHDAAPAPVTAAATPTPAAVAAQAEAARVLSPTAPQEITVTPAAGPAPPPTSADVDAVLSAAARAAAVPAAPALGPAAATRPQHDAAPLPASASTPAVHGKADVAAAIANAQAKADRFLSSGRGADAAAPAATEGKQAP